MMLTRRIKLQLATFAAIAMCAAAITALNYARLPALLLDVGQYTVTVELPESGGLYTNANVTYRGTEVGRVRQVQLTDTGVRAVLALDSDVAIPADVAAEVHSQSAVGEQYVALLPKSDAAPPLRNGDVIPRNRTSVPVDINSLLNAADRGLTAIPQDQLKTAIDEAFLAVGGLGPELSRIVSSSTTLASDAHTNVDALTALIDNSPPVLDSQAETSDAIQAWAAQMATITDQLRSQDTAVAGVLERGGPAADAARQLFERLQPTLPLLLANLVSVGEVAVTYQANIEQLLVLIPQGTQVMQGIGVANRHTKQDYRGIYLSFNLNTNLPPPCATGFLPAQQRRTPASEDAPARPPGDLYCRVPQDSPFNVRGARNIPCQTVPGKRAPTVAMCDSDDNYVPLNNGYNWKGDPNATNSGQVIPQPPPDHSAPQSQPQPPQPPPVAVAEYDPATGTYLGPDGHVYTQADLAGNASRGHTWQEMLMPPTSK